MTDDNKPPIPGTVAPPAPSGDPEITVDDAVAALLGAPPPEGDKAPGNGVDEGDVIQPQGQPPQKVDPSARPAAEPEPEPEPFIADDDEPASTDPAPVAGQPPLTDPAPAEEYLFEHDGRRITTDEARDGYLRQADYTRKSQTLATERTAFDDQVQAVQAERAQYVQALGALKQALEAGGEAEPNWKDLEQADPVDYLRQREIWRDKKDRAVKIETEQQRVHADMQVTARDQAVKVKTAEAGHLLAALPTWSDPKIMEREQAAIRNYATSLGFTADEVSQIYDHRVVLALRDAARGRQSITNRKAAQQRGAKVPNVVRSGNSQRVAPTTVGDARQRQADDRLSKSGSIDDAVDVLMARDQVRAGE